MVVERLLWNRGTVTENRSEPDDCRDRINIILLPIWHTEKKFKQLIYPYHLTRSS